MSWLASNLAPLMLLALVPLLLSGVPVTFALVACGLGFGAIGVGLDILPVALVGALPLRLFGIISNEALLAIPFFTFMGLILQRSGMAEDLLETVGQVFGPVRGGLALAVVLVGALLAATTGIIAASVISMGLISLPIMLRNGYHPRLACGVITASGSLTQVVPPSLVLIVMADQLGRSVGDMYAAALLPAALLIGGYAAWIGLVAVFQPGRAPAVPIDRQPPREPGGGSGHRSLAALALASGALGWGLLQAYPTLLGAIGRAPDPPPDETVIVAVAACVLSAFLLALLDRVTRLDLLSALARRVAFVLVPPLMLILTVLGSVYLGVATPTESGAIGACGAWALAASRRRMPRHQLNQCLLESSKLACVVMLLMFGSTVFSLSFQALEGNHWVEELLVALPGGTTGFLVFVMALVFVLGCFLDFFEIAIVLLPLLAPFADKLGIDLVWFGVLVGINLQTSFMTPPFGFALFFLRSVAPRPQAGVAAAAHPSMAVSTRDITLGALPFVVVQILVLAMIIGWPEIVTGGMHRAAPALDAAVVERQLREMSDAAYRQPPPDPVRLLHESLSR